MFVTKFLAVEFEVTLYNSVTVPYPYEVKQQIGHGKWFHNTNLFLITPFLIAKFDCIIINNFRNLPLPPHSPPSVGVLSSNLKFIDLPIISVSRYSAPSQPFAFPSLSLTW